MIAGNFVLVHYVRALDAHLLAEVDKYDPGTPEAERASEEWASDTGRSFALVFSAPLTAIWYLAPVSIALWQPMDSWPNVSN